ncbi:DNA primase large subunit PriL [Methanomicrobium antiquum]|uniref:DNA primase large subunit PriL n=1 Tax=Methanomicrobium antiquum TaxID=487686 RepID=A0AAF0JN62_9EURY|nr:DNA primase large subunit PriL [Methanomicrobium antiquum]WFN37827.1 DNA primase large subunit PriL [Methanomicrobium antiquum]
MPVELENKDLAKYPFLKEAHNFVSQRAYSIENFLKSRFGERICISAQNRIKAALESKFVFDEIRLEKPDDEILSYAVSRLIVSCMKERQMIDKLCRYESERAFYFLQTEDSQKKDYVARNVGIKLDVEKISVPEYVELVPNLRDSRWQLVNRDVSEGSVSIKKEELEELLKERIRVVLHGQLPLPVTDGICSLLDSFAGEISAVYQEKLLEQFGEVDEGSFPPCMKAIINAVSAGTNIPHTARFSLTAFMHTIGMDTTGIVEVYTRAPDFDVEKTLYQVEHISGRSGTEYTPPGCATMKTYGLCVGPDSICRNKNIIHPLSYYKYKKKYSKVNEKNKDAKEKDSEKENNSKDSNIQKEEMI